MVIRVAGGRSSHGESIGIVGVGGHGLTIVFGVDRV